GQAEESQEVATTITPKMLEKVEKDSGNPEENDKWVEDLSQKGIKVIEKTIKRYAKLTNVLNDINELNEHCENELYYWEGILPKLDTINQLDEDLVEREGIVPPEEKGTQYAMEYLAKIRVEVVNQVKEKLEIEKDWVGKSIDTIDNMIE
ncbi:hypothetical protein KI387_041196, partial [Taxus chinensis]